MRPRFPLPFTVLGLLAPASAIQELASRPAPANPLLSASMAGPGALVRSALPTNLGTLLASESCRFLWDEARATLREDSAETWKELEPRLLAWQGRIDLELFVDRRLHADRPMQHLVHGEILIWSDPGGKLDELAAALRNFLVAATRSEPRTMAPGNERQVEVLGRPGRDGVSLPMPWAGDHRVLFFGDRIDDAVTQGLLRLQAAWPARAARAKASPPASGDLLDVRLDGRQLATLIDDEMHREEERTLVQRVLGTKSWGEARCRVSTQGPRLELTLTADFLDGDRGVFGVLLPEATTLPSLIARAPDGQPERPPAFLAAHVRLDRGFSLFLEVMSRFGGQGKGPEEMGKELAKELGFDLQRDFFAHLDTEVLALAHLTEAVLERDRAAPDADGLCFLMRVRDDAAFAKTFDRLGSHKDLKPMPKILKAGFELLPVRFLDRGEYFARAPGWFAYAIGPRGLLALEQFAAARPAPDPAQTRGAEPELPRAARGLRRRIPPGWNALGVLPARILRDSLSEEAVWEVWKEIRSDLPRSVRGLSREELTRHAVDLAGVLEKARLSELVLLGGFEGAPADGKGGPRARLVLSW